MTAVKDISDRVQRELERVERKTLYEFLFNKNSSVMLIIDPGNGAIVDANDAASSFYGYSKETLQTMLISEINVTPQEELLKEIEKANSEERCCFHFQHRIADGSLVAVEVFSGPVLYEGASLLCSIIHDITERKEREAEREKLIAELQQASHEISTLRGILPICSHCKNIRNDKGSWDRIEAYIHQHADIEFSHGICPDCIQKQYPEIADTILEKVKPVKDTK